MLKALTFLASPGGSRGRLAAFIFHRVLAVPEPLLPGEPDAQQFGMILDWITGQFRVLDPLEACRRLSAGTLPARAAILTFDDGYRDNFDIALPLLQARGLKAAFFIASGFSDGSAMFNDRINHAIRSTTREALTLPWLPGVEVKLYSSAARLAAIERLIGAVKYCPPAERNCRVESIVQAAGADAPAGLMMNQAHLQALAAAGMNIGGHTRSHPILLSLPEDEARREIEGGLRDLADLTGSPPSLFAYPNGRFGEDFDERHVEMVRRVGCEFAFTTDPGASSRRTLPWQLRRFTPWDRLPGSFSRRALRNLVGIR